MYVCVCLYGRCTRALTFQNVCAGALLDKTVLRNDTLKRVSQLHEFESDRLCGLCASQYLLRIMRYGKCSPSCAVVGLIYLQVL
jgi:hypothetical protein